MRDVNTWEQRHPKLTGVFIIMVGTVVLFVVFLGLLKFIRAYLETPPEMRIVYEVGALGSLILSLLSIWGVGFVIWGLVRIIRSRDVSHGGALGSSQNGGDETGKEK